MECPNGCTSAMRIIHVERIFQGANGPVVIRDLEMYSCAECGCESMPLKSARIVENVLSGRMQAIGQFSAPLFAPA